jgi:hypothetical protein
VRRAGDWISAVVRSSRATTPPVLPFSRAHRRVRRCVVRIAVLALAASLVVGADRALAAWGTPATAATSFGAATLAAPTTLTATGSSSVTLSWTASTSTWASGHRVLRSTQPGGPFTQIAELTPLTTTSYTDSPGTGMFYYRVRAFYAGSTWISADSNEAPRPAILVFKSTTTFTTAGNCMSANRQRDMELGFAPTDPEETYVRSTDGTLAFCSDTFSAGQTLAAGTTTVNAYFRNTNVSSSCDITATLYKNGTLSLGSGTITIPKNTATTLGTWSFSTSGVTFAGGDRLNLYLDWPNTPACKDTYLHYDGASTDSRVTVPTIGKDSYAAAVLGTSGLVAHWRLGDTSGTTAVDSKSTNNGTYAGGYTLGQAGALTSTDPAVDFDGTSGRISVPDAASLNPTSQVSIEAWVKPDTVTGNQYIAHKGTNYYLYLLDNKTVCGVRTPSATYAFVQPLGLTTTGTWQHLVCTFDGSKVVLYRNGVNAAEIAATTAIDTSTTSLFIGAFDATQNYYDGAIDEVAVYNFALTATQVQDHYNAR